MTTLEQHATVYADQPERREAYLSHLTRERALAALEAELAPQPPKPATKTKQSEA